MCLPFREGLVFILSESETTKRMTDQVKFKLMTSKCPTIIRRAYLQDNKSLKERRGRSKDSRK